MFFARQKVLQRALKNAKKAKNALSFVVKKSSEVLEV